MRSVPLRKISPRDPEADDDLKSESPQELLGVVWQPALDAWSFKEDLNAEPRLQRHVAPS